MRPRAWASVFAVLMLAMAPASKAAPPQANAKLLDAVKACDKPARALMKQAVAIDSGTGDAEGLAAIGALFSAQFKALGADVKPMAPAPPAVGDNILATFTGTGKGRILLIPHMDTVFSRGDVAKRKPHWEGERYIGPGAGDDKSGEVTAVCALSALKAIGFKDFARIDVLMNASPAGDAVVARANRLYAELGHNLTPVSVGSSGDAALAAQMGAPTLDGFAMEGDGAHSVDDSADFSTLTPRAYLLARMLMDVGHDPK